MRPAQAGDVDALVEHYVAVAREGRWIASEPPFDVERRRARMLDRVEDHATHVLVAEAEGEVVGMLTVTATPWGFGEIGMSVAPSWRGRGVGTALLEGCVEWARERRLHKLSLEVFPHNEAALALYRKFGFQEEGYLRQHYRRRNGERWDSVVMGLLLDR